MWLVGRLKDIRCSLDTDPLAEFGGCLELVGRGRYGSVHYGFDP